MISGELELKPIPDTSLSWVANSGTPILQVSPTSWYACQAGVWFTASSVVGPWSVAASVPPVIYSIPPSSPIYYVTYVRIYDVTPHVVVTRLHARLHGDRGRRRTAWSSMERATCIPPT